ncbi:MAG: alpha/beta hydrolase [Anaerolineae bacterium]|nr:alpha/beta hydrolase [Anaerolineae bacterium]
MSIPTLAGITAKTITSQRLTTRVLLSGPENGAPVLFVHGNISAATWWEETMLALPAGYRAIAPDQRGYGESDPAKKIDATRGLGDLADDLAALLDTLNIQKVHLVGHSMGGSVVWRFMMDYTDRLLSVTQVAPGSPYGFGCTKDVAGTPCNGEFAGSGAGLINPEFARLLTAGERGTGSMFAPRNALRNLVFKPPFVPAREEEILSATLSTHMGQQDYPGDSVPASAWPHLAPGVLGANNALSPKYNQNILPNLLEMSYKPKVLWIRGAQDLTVSDTAAADVGRLGSLGLIPGWPGKNVFPPQPMLAQTRDVLQKYAAAGGAYQEVVIDDCGHAPYLEKPAEFNAAFHAHITT